MLETRFAGGYLLLKHNIGCQDFKGMCCFNLFDHSRSIQSHIQALHEIANNIKKDVDSSSWWDWLLSWLPDLSWLRTLFISIIIIIAYLIIICCCIQCIPSLIQICCVMCAKPTDPGQSYATYLSMRERR